VLECMADWFWLTEKMIKKKGNEKIENREGQRAKNGCCGYCGYWLGGCYGWPSKKERGIMLKSLMH